jgi:nicotinamidase-related amidase
MEAGEVEDLVVDGTAPYPWPWDGRLEPSRLALVAVGCQRWWADRTLVADRALAALERTASAVRDAGGLVVAVRHSRPAGAARRRGMLPRPGERDWQFVASGVGGDVVIDAMGIDAFFGSSLDADLRSLGRDTLVLGGLGLETAIYSTMTGGNDRGYECLALIDASAPHDPAVAARALASIKMSGGIFGAVGTSTSLCAALAGARVRLRKEPA